MSKINFVLFIKRIEIDQSIAKHILTLINLYEMASLIVYVYIHISNSMQLSILAFSNELDTAKRNKKKQKNEKIVCTRATNKYLNYIILTVNKNCRNFYPVGLNSLSIIFF